MSNENFLEQLREVTEDILSEATEIPAHCLACPLLHLKAQAYGRFMLRKNSLQSEAVADFEEDIKSCVWDGEITSGCYHPEAQGAS